MKERPLPFSAPMVRALLAGTKTQTRRPLKVQPIGAPHAGKASLTKSMSQPVFYAMWEAPAADGSTCCICPYGVPGDRLWVREAWRACRDLDKTPPRDIEPGSSIEFEATKRSYAEVGLVGKLRPGMFMPRWASRITLEITGVRVERLQDISEADALAEGIERHDVLTDGNAPPGFHAYTYSRVWEQINGADSWSANPWVWVVEFRRVV